MGGHGDGTVTLAGRTGRSRLRAENEQLRTENERLREELAYTRALAQSPVPFFAACDDLGARRAAR